MKTKDYKKAKFSYTGMLLFFILVATLMQAAILVYDFVSKRTSNKVTIALIIFGVILFLSGVCTLIDFFRRRLMVERPVKRILAATEKIAKGEFDTRVEMIHSYDKYDGYDRIAENLNIMAKELGKSEMLKSDFISNVSHEMKTPLSVIHSYCSALRDPSLDTQTKEKYLKTICDASARLSSLVTDILKLNKLEHQAIKPEAESVDLLSMLSEAIIAYEAEIEKKELVIECDLDEVTINSVSSYLEIVFGNLISNAVKFTPRGGRISFTLKRVDEGASVSIRDTGVGMNAEVGSKIFEKFYQGDTSHASEGNGLGLPMVKRVIDLLGGSISVESEVGAGSCFTIILGSIN